jgi:hypothetical protein
LWFFLLATEKPTYTLSLLHRRNYITRPQKPSLLEHWAILSVNQKDEDTLVQKDLRAPVFSPHDGIYVVRTGAVERLYTLFIEVYLAFDMSDLDQCRAGSGG